MQLIKSLLALMLLLGATAGATTLAVIDSGTDTLHKDLLASLWINPIEGEISNDRDEDRNGYQDDIYGWNFAEGNNLVIDPKYRNSLTTDIRKFFALQAKSFYGTITEEEREWIKTKLSDQEFLKSIQVYGNFMHGTHVAGITVAKNPTAKILSVKLIPTEVALPGQKEIDMAAEKGLGLTLAKLAMGQLAKAQLTTMIEIAAYVNSHKARVANGSFGTGYPQAKMIAELIGKPLKLTEEEITEVAKHFLTTLNKEGLHFVSEARNTLFVFAAGNDGLSNDDFGSFPTNIDADNVISVAATIDAGKLASFSNYGKKTVDVAAPGVAINSTVPDNMYLKVSGTSQAAPYVSNVAARVSEINAELMPVQIKKIIMKTVDMRRSYASKVKAGGDVNMLRAVQAAENSLKMDLDKAIELSHNQITTKDLEKGLSKDGSLREGYVLPMPSPFVLK